MLKFLILSFVIMSYSASRTCRPENNLKVYNRYKSSFDMNLMNIFPRVHDKILRIVSPVLTRVARCQCFEESNLNAFFKTHTLLKKILYITSRESRIRRVPRQMIDRLHYCKNLFDRHSELNQLSKTL